MTQGGRKPTKAERKEEARKARLEEMKRRQRKARMRKLTYGGIAVLAVAGIVVAVLASQSGNRAKAAELDKLAAAAGCETVRTPADQGRQHIQPPQTVQYNSQPPTSGNHYPGPTSTGVHTTKIQNEVQVHNLEHGHVVLSYKPDLDQAFIDKLEEVVKVDDTRVLVAPYDTMPYKVALTAWGQISGCAEPNDKVVDFAKAFAERFKGKGPEGDIPGRPA